jgi:hypothetical protein
VLDVAAAALNTNAASPAGSNVNPVVVGDPVAGLDAELRVGGGGNRGLTVQSGAGRRTIRFTGNAAAYTNVYTLDKDTVFAPGIRRTPPARTGTPSTAG